MKTLLKPSIDTIAPPIENQVEPSELRFDELIPHRKKLSQFKYVEKQTKRHYGDDEPLQTHLQKIQSMNSISLDLSKAQSYQKLVQTRLREIDYEPSSAQMACIAAAAMSREKRLLLVVPAGKGKSRIVAGIGVVEARQIRKKGAKIVIGFSSEILLQTDQAVYEKL